MTNRTVVGIATFWTLGLAVILGTSSYARQRARECSEGLRTVLAGPEFQAAIDAGLALVYVGLFFNARSIWAGVTWAVLAMFSAAMASREWLAQRERRGKIR